MLTLTRFVRTAGRQALAAGLALVATTACGPPADGPPDVTVDRSVCAHCGMLVSDLRTAAGHRSASGSEVRVFDDIGCLVDAHTAGTVDLTAGSAWLHDSTGGGWLPAAEAWIVRAPSIQTPMGGGMLAFDSYQAADRHAASTGDAEVVRLTVLLASHGVGTKSATRTAPR